MSGVLFVDDANPGDTIAVLRSDRSFQYCKVTALSSLGVSSFNGRIGAVLPAFSDYETSLVEDDSGLVPAATPSSQTLFQLATPFKNSLHVDPSTASTNLQKGTPGFPFRTMAAAIADAVGQGWTACVFLVPSRINITESFALPNTGGQWEIRSYGEGLASRTTITGNITCDSATQSFFTLAGLSVVGTVAGTTASGAGCFIYLRDTAVSSTGNFVGTGAGVWFGDFIGSGTNFFAFGGSIGGALTFTGQLFTQNWYLNGALSLTGGPHFFDATRFVTGSITQNGALPLTFQDCEFTVATTITGSGAAATVIMDGYSDAGVNQVGLTLANASMKTKNSNVSVRSQNTTGIVATVFNVGAAAHQPFGLYRVTGTLTLIATGVGTASLDITYTDLTGTLVTRTVTTLAMAGLPGLEGRGDIIFSHNGATSITYAVSGVPTGTYNLGAALKRED